MSPREHNNKDFSAGAPTERDKPLFRWMLILHDPGLLILEERHGIDKAHAMLLPIQSLLGGVPFEF